MMTDQTKGPRLATAQLPRRLADFTADPRTLVLAALALCIGTLGAATAWLLVKLIALVTNLVWFGRLGGESMSLAHAARTPWMVAAPALGGLAIGLMARYGSPKIRGHGIPEAIETILIGKSRIGPKIAILKPISSANATARASTCAAARSRSPTPSRIRDRFKMAANFFA